MCGCCSKEETKNLPICLPTAWRKLRRFALRDGGKVSRFAQDRYQALRTAEDGHYFRTRCRQLCLLSRRTAVALQRFTMREGNIVGRREFFWEDIEDDFNPASFLRDVLAQYYSSDYVPREIYVPDIEECELLERALSERKGRRVRISYSQRGEKRDMIDLGEKNAKLAFEQRFRVLRPDMKLVLEELQETLELPRFPARIESFDVSNIQGAENVAGMVVCENGKMNRSEYRKFRIRTVEGSNDVASMREGYFADIGAYSMRENRCRTW